MAFDPNQHPDKNFAPPTPGEKVAAWVRVATEQTTKNGNPYFPTTLVILADRVAAQGEKGDKGRLLFDDVMTAQNMQWRLAKVCRAVKNLTPFDERDHKAMQKRLMLNDAGEAVAVVVVVANESYTKNDGTPGTKAKIVDFKPYGGAWADDFDALIDAGEKAAKEAAAKADGKRSGSGGGSGSGSGGGARPARGGGGEESGLPFDGGAGVDDGDIPF